MSTLYIVAGILVVAIFLAAITKKTKPSITQNADNKKYDYSKSYKQKWLFSYNEKDAYHKIKEVTDSLGYFLFAKVRLFDLVEPIKGCENYKGALWKIQAKHVDFVICDQKLVAHWVIELDDNSHNAEDRQERDSFVDAILTSCGYKVLHTKNITTENLELWLNP